MSNENVSLTEYILERTYGKDESYSKTEISNILNQLGGVGGGSVFVVDTLPSSSIQSDCLYLVENEDTYKFYVYIDNDWVEIKTNSNVSVSDISVDNSFIENSSNPVQSKVIQTALNSKADNNHNHNSSYYTKSEVDNKISNTGGGVTVDSSLSTSSTNPVQNKVVTTSLNNKSDTNHTHSGYASSSHNHDDRYYTKSEIDVKQFSGSEVSLDGYVKTTDIVNDVTTDDANKPLSAKQGKYLNDIIVARNSLLDSLEEGMNATNDGLTNLKNNLISFNQALIVFNDGNVDLAEDLSTLHDNLSTFLGNIGEFIGTLDELSPELSGLIDDLSVFSDYLLEFDGDLDEFEDELEEANIDSDKLNTDIGKLIQSIIQLKKRATDVEELAGDAKEQAEGIKTELVGENGDFGTPQEGSLVHNINETSESVDTAITNTDNLQKQMYKGDNGTGTVEHPAPGSVMADIDDSIENIDNLQDLMDNIVFHQIEVVPQGSGLSSTQYNYTVGDSITILVKANKGGEVTTTIPKASIPVSIIDGDNQYSTIQYTSNNNSSYPNFYVFDYTLTTSGLHIIACGEMKVTIYVKSAWVEKSKSTSSTIEHYFYVHEESRTCYLYVTGSKTLQDGDGPEGNKNIIASLPATTPTYPPVGKNKNNEPMSLVSPASAGGVNVRLTGAGTLIANKYVSGEKTVGVTCQFMWNY